ncbi:helix-turn-helix domain-containing protein [Streptomyces sp. NPDC004528]|uniref:helix-turn-helix domain-containing protein n=1 Tax=Streptomyces sp. NPDC004528 TaxID=3154550 RepID=UPI0033A8681A
MNPGRTLAAKLSWLLDHSKDPAGRPWTLRSLADATRRHDGKGMSHATIGKIADGDNDNPRIRTLETLAATLGVSPGFFFSLYELKDLPSVRMFGDPRARRLLELMEGLDDADLAAIESVIKDRRSARDAARSTPLPEHPRTETPRRPGRRRSSPIADAARRAADSLE